MANRRLSGGGSPFYGGNYGNFEYNVKFLGRRSVRHSASGVGIFIFAYSVLMYALSYGMVYLLKYLCAGSPEFQSSYTTAVYFLDIFVSTLAALLPALVYVKATRQDLSRLIPIRCVKASMLLPLVFMGMGVAMFANVASSVLAQNFSLFGIENAASSSGSGDKNVLEIALDVISVAIVPAFAEEFAFRGVAMGAMRRFGDGTAILLSSVLFAAMHQNIGQIPFAFILGLALAYVDCVSGSIVPSIVIHFVNNLYVVVLRILHEQGVFGDSAYSTVSSGLMLFFCVAGIISYIILSKKNGSVFKITESSQALYEYGAEPSRYLSFKEKTSAVFTSLGVVLCLVFFAISTVMNLGLIDGWC